MTRILVVDDDPHARLLLRTLLTHAGYEVREAADGAVAQALVAEEPPPELVILDLALPGMSGTELVRALRLAERTRELRIALYTASAPDAAMRDFMTIYGIAGRLPKPSEPRELLAAIAALIDAN